MTDDAVMPLAAYPEGEKENMAAESICLVTLLGTCACEDILWKRIHVFVILAGAICGVLLHIAYRRLDIVDVIGGFAVGGGMLLVSIFSRGRIGLADALLLMTTGIYLGFIRNLELLWLASVLTGFVGMILLIRGRVQGMQSHFSNVRIPFAPALLAVVITFLLLSKGRLV